MTKTTRFYPDQTNNEDYEFRQSQSEYKISKKLCNKSKQKKIFGNFCGRSKVRERVHTMGSACCSSGGVGGRHGRREGGVVSLGWPIRRLRHPGVRAGVPVRMLLRRIHRRWEPRRPIGAGSRWAIRHGGMTRVGRGG